MSDLRRSRIDARRETASVGLRTSSISGIVTCFVPERSQKACKISFPPATILQTMSRDADWDGADDGACDPALLLGEHGRWLRTVLLARSGEPAAIDELFQEVAVAVLKRPPTQVAEAKRPAWLYGVAVRVAILHRRRLGRRRRLMERFTAAASLAVPSTDPLGWLLADERQRLVRQALQRLSPKDRELLLLKYTEEWSYVEIADHVGLTTSAVEARLHRARARLRAELAAQEVVESVG